MKTLFDFIKQFKLTFYKATRQGDSKNPLNEIVFNFKSCSDSIADKLEQFIDKNSNSVSLKALHPFETSADGSYAERDMLLTISLKRKDSEYTTVNPLNGNTITKKRLTNSISLIEELPLNNEKDLNNRLTSLYDSMDS